MSGAEYSQHGTQGRPSAQNGVRNRLPTLDEVLLRKTAPPVDLFCFYIFLQREGQEDVLDFWLDVHQHENLCRAYFKDIRKSGRSLASEWPQYWDRALTHGSGYDQAAGITPKLRESYHQQGRPLSGHSQGHSGGGRSSEGGHHFPGESSYSAGGDGGRFSEKAGSGSGGLDAPMRRVSGERSPVEGSFPPLQGGGEKPQRLSGGGGWTNGLGLSGGGLAGTAGREKRRASRAPTVIPRTSAITKGELLLSAERIYARYLVPGSEKEVYLPPTLRPPPFPLPASLSHADSADLQEDASILAQVPDMFVNQKAYAHSVLAQDAYPRFLRAKAFSNLSPFTSFLRLLFGLLFAWAGLVAAFCFIFLDIQPRRLRVTLLVPFYIASHLLLSALYALDPLYVLLLNRSETTPFKHIAIKERYVRKLLVRRSIWLEVLIILITVVMLMIWLWLPGHRL